MIEIPANIVTFFNELENDEMIEFLAQLTEYAAQVFGDHPEGVIEYED
jgi:hypothetical protein